MPPQNPKHHSSLHKCPRSRPMLGNQQAFGPKKPQPRKSRSPAASGSRSGAGKQIITKKKAKKPKSRGKGGRGAALPAPQVKPSPERSRPRPGPAPAPDAAHPAERSRGGRGCAAAAAAPGRGRRERGSAPPSPGLGTAGQRGAKRPGCCRGGQTDTWILQQQDADAPVGRSRGTTGRSEAKELLPVWLHSPCGRGQSSRRTFTVITDVYLPGKQPKVVSNAMCPRRPLLHCSAQGAQPRVLGRQRARRTGHRAHPRQEEPGTEPTPGQRNRAPSPSRARDWGEGPVRGHA